MKNSLKNILAIIILTAIFIVNYVPYHGQMPQHVDSWIVISNADFVLDEQELKFIEPFSYTYSSYPPGSHLSLAVITSITGLNMLFLAQLLPGIFFVMLGMLLYLVSKELFKNDIASLCVMAFTFLSLSNITMLGPFYLVPFIWGMLLSLLFFYFILKNKWKTAFLIFIAIALTHRTSMVFALLALGLYLVLNRENWKKLKYLLIIAITSLIIFFASGGAKLFYSMMQNLFVFEKSEPYISFRMSLGLIIIFLIGLGFYLILTREKKASSFLIPLFSLMALNAFIYWNWQGFFIVYRRLFPLTFMFSSFFVGYAVYSISIFINKILPKKIRKYNLALIILLIIFVPMAVNANIESRKNNNIHVTNDENILFSKFGEIYPGEYLATDHLEAFSLPYYNLKPVQLSPAHGTTQGYFNQLSPCYMNRIPECFAGFLYKYNFTYVYTGTKINTSYFKPVLKYNGKEIYEIQKEEFKEHMKKEFNVTINTAD